MSERVDRRVLPQILAFSLLAVALALASAGSGDARATSPAKASATTLVGTVGPGFTISLTKSGKAVKTLKAGTYTITVRDRSPIHDFHLSGPGVNKTSGVPFSGTVVWKSLKLKKGSYKFFCDPHSAIMKGSFKVTA